MPSPACGPGEEGRYEEFLRHYSRDRDRIFAYIFSLLPHHADAEDVFQKCSIVIWRKFAQFDAEGSFLRWACGIASHEINNFLRVSGRNRLHFDVELVARLAERKLSALEHDEDKVALLRKCLEKLDSPERELIEVVYAKESSIEELARNTDRAVQTLYNRLSQIRRRLFFCVQRSLGA